jgi:uncharacterized protein YjbJ (UPF0337 family)
MVADLGQAVREPPAAAFCGLTSLAVAARWHRSRLRRHGDQCHAFKRTSSPIRGNHSRDTLDVARYISDHQPVRYQEVPIFWRCQVSESSEQLEGETEEKVGPVAGDENTAQESEGQSVQADIEEGGGTLREGLGEGPGREEVRQ